MILSEEVYTFLNSIKSLNEEVKIDYFHNEHIRDVEVIDFYLPEGCRMLKYPPRTAIVVKNKITSGTIDNAIKSSNILYKKGSIELFVLISRNIPRSANSRKNRLKDGFILVDFDSLSNTVERDYGPIYYNDDRSWEEKREYLIERARYQFLLGKNTFLLGAGVSQDAGFPGWDLLLNNIQDDLLIRKKITQEDIDAIMMDGGNDSLIKARYLKSHIERSKYQFVPIIRKVLYANHPKHSDLLTVIAKAISNGKVVEAITYNYDELLERYLEDMNVEYSSVDSQNRPTAIGTPILHVHGFIPQKATDNLYDKNVVLSEDDYHTLYRDAFHWANVEQMHALLQTTCFFIGLSLKDPSIRRLMDIANMHGSRNAEHFAFLRRKEYKDPQKAEELFMSMGTNVIWYEQFVQLPTILQRIFL